MMKRNVKNIKSKRGMVLPEILGIVIASIIVFFIAYKASAYFNLVEKQKYIDSYSNLVKAIEQTTYLELGDITSSDLLMKEKSFIAFFSSEGNEISFDLTKELPRTRTEIWPTFRYYYTIRKPDIEKCKNACSCLCNDVIKINLEVKGEQRYQEISCKDYICNSFEDIDFLNEFKKEDYLKNFKGGMIVQRNILDKDVKDVKLRTAYIQKKDKVIVCFKKPCIENE